MDRNLEEEELQFLLGLFGIYKESSFNIIFSWPKIFTKITLIFVLPPTFIILAHSLLSQLNREFSNIIHNHGLLLEVAYPFFLIIFSILFTSAVVYSVASSSIYTKEKEQLTFKKAIITVIPKVCKRLMDTFLWSFIDAFIYNAVVVVLLVLTPTAVSPNAGTALVFVLLVLFLSGVVYINIVWQLTLVISVLEDFKGIEAFIKSEVLIRGMKVAYKIILNLIILFILIFHTVWV